MRTLVHSFALILALAANLAAQNGGVALIPGSQANTSGASLSASGSVRPFQQTPIPFTATAPGSLSATLLSSHVFAWLPPTVLPITDLDLVLGGAPNAPFALVATAPQLNINCSTLNPPCGMVSPWMPATIATGVGTYHVGFPFVAVLDGIGVGGGTPAALDAQGGAQLSVSVPWSTANLSFSPESFAVQALMADPASPAGYTLSAAFSNQRVPISCAACATGSGQ